MSFREIFASQPFLITANVLSGILSVVVVGLTADNLAYVRTRRAKYEETTVHYNISMSGRVSLQEAQIALLPAHLKTGSYWLLLAVGIAGFLNSIFLGGMLFWRRLKAAEMQATKTATTDRNLFPQTPLSIFSAVAAFCWSLAATVYSFTDWSRSGVFSPASNFALTPGNRYESDFFTPDAWNCQLEDYIPSQVESSRLENLCSEGTGARSITLAITVLSAFVLWGILWRTYRRHQAKSATPLPDFSKGRSYRASSSVSDEKTAVDKEKQDEA